MRAMIISHRKRFVVFSPWKTASQTTLLRLHKYSEGSYPLFFYFNPYLQRVVHQHISRADFECLPEAKLSYYLAAFVRNPYDRAYSGFNQLQRDIQEQPRAEFPSSWIRDLVRRQLVDNFSQLCQAGFDFNTWISLVREEQIYETGSNSNFPLHPAHYWTHISNEKRVDFMGKVENFEEDFSTLCAKLSLDHITEGNANESAINNGRSNAQGYRYTHLMSASSIDKINHLFHDDFLLLGYDPIAPR